MDDVWKTALWQQFGASIDMLDNAASVAPASSRLIAAPANMLALATAAQLAT